MSVYTDVYRNVEYPVLVTRGIVVFPNNDVGLQVGRQKSINALNISKERFDSVLLVITQKDPMVEEPSIGDLYRYGTLCSIKSLRNEKLRIHGICRARINNLYDNGDSFFANVSAEETTPINDKELEEVVRQELLSAFSDLAESQRTITVNFQNQFMANINLSHLTDIVGQTWPMDLSIRQDILEETDLNERANLVISQIELTKVGKKLDEELDKKVKDTVDKNQRNYLVREKIKALRDELGDNEGENDVDKFERIFNEKPYPENIKKKAKEEIRKLQNGYGGPEDGKVVDYLEFLSKIPFWQESDDEKDINKISQILDEDHYGLKKVKERILEFIAVKNFTNTLKAPIICLYGPPGVGKTSLAKSIARALNRSYVKMSVGGITSESEIRGFRRTYLGSNAGNVMMTMKKAGTINPVFLIDEIDKMGYVGANGDPRSAMLEVLDPEQNFAFQDHFVEEPYDLSKVLFICTANDISTIPAPLRDRMEMIEVPSYTEEEKVHIALEHLVKKQLDANGLNDKQFKIHEEEILYLIRYYTREAGVRSLERNLGSLCRKAVLSISKGERKTVTINKKIINEWLGKEKFDFGNKEKEDQVGVVTGLAYTQFGGDVLPIEVTYFDGKGTIITTGSLGDVMKESAIIAVDYVKSNASKYNIEPSFFEKHDIHIHAPEGATPKDGPSAGVTLTTAVVSAITKKKASKDIAMTGEVTLRGNVLAIGGLREKAMAAYRSNIKNIVLPKENMKDLDEVPEIVKNEMNFIPVERVDEVIDVALR